MNAVVNIANTPFDHEFYPTTEEIMAAVEADIRVQLPHSSFTSILDVGAGDGRVLKRLGGCAEKYGIEKSELLLRNMPPDVMIVGTHFEQQTLIDKRVDVLFSNPPYSCFEQWVIKIISEGNFKVAYLVIPSRWAKSDKIKGALKARQAVGVVLGAYDFLSADRRARAVVDLIRIEPARVAVGRRFHRREFTDPFRAWFDNTFSINAHKVREEDDYLGRSSRAQSKKEQNNSEIVPGCDVVEVLENLYRRDIDYLISTYKRLETLDYDLLKELNVDLNTLCGSLAAKISNTKNVYWREVFDRLGVVTEKLTSASRGRFLESLTKHVNIDFTASNVRAVLIFVIKNANAYFDKQLLDVFGQLISKANCVNYKSNDKTFGQEGWRYRTRLEDVCKVKLDYRVVLERSGGITRDSWSHKCGLEGRAADLLDDLCTLAINLGFDAAGNIAARERAWESGQKHVWWMEVDGKKTELFSVRAFLNGNMHISFNSRFILKLNVEVGRLLGWVKNWSQAADEMGEDEAVCAEAWKSNFEIPAGGLLLGCF